MNHFSYCVAVSGELTFSYRSRPMKPTDARGLGLSYEELKAMGVDV